MSKHSLCAIVIFTCAFVVKVDSVVACRIAWSLFVFRWQMTQDHLKCECLRLRICKNRVSVSVVVHASSASSTHFALREIWKKCCTLIFRLIVNTRVLSRSLRSRDKSVFVCNVAVLQMLRWLGLEEEKTEKERKPPNFLSCRNWKFIWTPVERLNQACVLIMINDKRAGKLQACSQA